MLRAALSLLLLGLVLAFAPARADPVYQSQTTACTHAATFAGTAGPAQIVAGTATGQIYVCGFTFWATAAGTVQLEYGTGSNCASVGATITPAFSLPATGGFSDHQPYYEGITPVPAGSNLCVLIGSTGPVPGIVYYAQF